MVDGEMTLCHFAIEFAKAQINLDAQEKFFDYVQHVDPDATPRQRKEAKYNLYWAKVERDAAKEGYLDAQRLYGRESKAAGGKGVKQ